MFYPIDVITSKYYKPGSAEENDWTVTKNKKWTLSHNGSNIFTGTQKILMIRNNETNQCSAATLKNDIVTFNSEDIPLYVKNIALRMLLPRKK